jgi:hypothetical protein
MIIVARPQLRETFMSALGRGPAASGGGYGGPAHLKYKLISIACGYFAGEKRSNQYTPVRMPRL